MQCDKDVFASQYWRSCCNEAGRPWSGSCGFRAESSPVIVLALPKNKHLFSLKLRRSTYHMYIYTYFKYTAEIKFLFSRKLYFIFFLSGNRILPWHFRNVTSLSVYFKMKMLLLLWPLQYEEVTAEKSGKCSVYCWGNLFLIETCFTQCTCSVWLSVTMSAKSSAQALAKLCFTGLGRRRGKLRANKEMSTKGLLRREHQLREVSPSC